MYHREDQARSDRRGPDGPGRITPDQRARHALTRIDQALVAATPDLTLDRPRLRAALQTALPDPTLEEQRRFALGWLDWLDGHYAAATSCFSGIEGARATYWMARALLLTGKIEGVTAYEQAMRKFQGAAQATAWFVDLLWRCGKQERAAQVWKSLRSNKRIKECEEATLLETRALIAQGDVNAAENVLREATLQGGVLKAERLLLLAWCLSAKQKTLEATSRLEGAATALFPAAALSVWQLMARREAALPSWEHLLHWPASLASRAWIEAQQLRTENGATSEIAALLERTAGSTMLTPFIRYVRACLGLDDFAAVLGSLPGGFLGPRCRLWLMLGRFARGEATPAEALGALQQATAAGYNTANLSAWRSLAEALADQTLSPEQLWKSPSDRNRKRAALEMGLRRWTDQQGLPTLLTWATETTDDAALRQRLGRSLLRMVLRGVGGAEAINAASSLLPESDKPALVSILVHGEGEASASPSDSPTQTLWWAANKIKRGETDWRDAVSRIDDGVSLALLTHDAAGRGDVAALIRLLEPSPTWNRFASGPPRFVIDALAAVNDVGSWREALTRWLGQWPQSSALDKLRVRAGLSRSTETTAAPAHVEPAEWYVHQASQALGHDDARQALAWVRRAMENLQSLDEARRKIVETALPHLERRARAQWLAQVAQPADDVPAMSPSLFVEFSDLLQDSSEGRVILEETNLGQARERLAALVPQLEISPKLAHHLALIYQRAAQHYDAVENVGDAERNWLRAWRCWLRSGRSVEDAGLLFDHLLFLHRDRLEGLLARGDISRAKVFWEMVLTTLPKQIIDSTDPVAELLRSKLQQFRAELASAFLLETREAMRHGAIPEGWRADYEQGLNRLRRLLSLDRDNPYLLTAVIEICADWFLDLYDIPDVARLKQEVERYTPFAMQLMRSATREGRNAAEELQTRAALSEFVKFRAFVTDDPERKRDLYREALALNPANDNVRDLLGGIEG